MQTLRVDTQPPYDVLIGQEVLHQPLIDLCKQTSHRLVMITDTTVESLYAAEITQHLRQQDIHLDVLAITPGEQSKTRETKRQLEDQLLQLGCGRDIGIIALGGGVVTDIAGFVAATYCRGVPVIYIPTSLLAMVDASIGGKTGVNTPYGKNLIGTFTQPKGVLVDPQVLVTLPDAEYQNGLVEAVKHALIIDRTLFEHVEANIDRILQRDAAFLLEFIAQSARIKADIVSEDQLELTGKRQLLNYGHTIGHAIETVSDYSISHGRAVAIGIVAENYLAQQCGLLSHDDAKRIQDVFAALGISLLIEADFTAQKLMQCLRLDKKSVAKVPYFVLLEAIGVSHQSRHGYSMPVDESVLLQTIDFTVDLIRGGMSG